MKSTVTSILTDASARSDADVEQSVVQYADVAAPWASRSLDV